MKISALTNSQQKEFGNTYGNNVQIWHVVTEMPLALTLGAYPHPILRIECSKCGRSGRLNRDRLIREYGPDIPLPDLRHVLAQCPRRHKMDDPSAVVFPHLAG